jgi:hypothetical protein
VKLLWILSVSLVLVACGDDGGPVNPELRTLDTCETDIDPAAPAFYATYFRCVDVALDGDDVVITSTSLPPHLSGYYPAEDPNYIEFDTMDGERFKNPNTIAEQAISIRIPADPALKGVTIDDALVDGTAGTGEEYGGEQGVALNGVSMFAGFAAPGDDIEQEQFSFDPYEGHPQNTGRYHYHGASPGPLEVLAAAGISGDVELYGVMCDGTLVLGCTELDGTTPAGALDAQGGHVHDVGDGTTVHFAGRYHTHVCPGTYASFAPEVQAHVDGDDCVGGP